MIDATGIYELTLKGYFRPVTITTYADSPQQARDRIVAVRDKTRWPTEYKLAFCRDPHAMPVLKTSYADMVKQCQL